MALAFHLRSATQLRLLLALLVWALFAFGTVPAMGAVERVAGVAPDRISETVTTPNGRLLVTLRHSIPAGQPSDGAPVQLRPDAMFSSLASGGDIPATWRRLDTGRGPDADGRFQLVRGETATFEVRGTFNTPGSWETAIEALDAAGNIASRVVLAIVRTAPPPIPATLLSEPRLTRIDLNLWEAWTGAEHKVQLRARNAGTDPLPVGGSTIGEVSVVTGPSELAAALVESFSVPPRDCAGVLEAGQACSVTLSVPPGLVPGRYVAEVILSGASGGQSVRAQTVEVRASAWWAGCIAALGALLGALVTGWRTSGRQLVEARILAAERRRQASRLLEATTTLPAARRALIHLVERLRGLDAAIRRGTPSPDLAPYDERLQAIAAAVEAHAAAERFAAAQAVPIASAKADLAEALDKASRDATLDAGSSQAIATAAAALRDGVGAAEALIRAATEADDALALVGLPLRQLLANTAVSTAWGMLEDARAAAFLPLEKTETLAKRTTDLSKQTAVLRKQLAGTEVPDAILAFLQQAASADEKREKNLQIPLKDAGDVKRRWETLPLEERLRNANGFAETFARTHPDAFDSGTEVAAPARPEIPTVVPPGSAMTLDLDGLFSGPARLASLDELEGFRTWWNWLTNLAVLAGIGAAAVLILWVDNPVWGSPADFVTALLAGIGTRLAIGTVAART